MDRPENHFWLDGLHIRLAAPTGWTDEEGNKAIEYIAETEMMWNARLVVENALSELTEKHHWLGAIKVVAE